MAYTGHTVSVSATQPVYLLGLQDSCLSTRDPYLPRLEGKGHSRPPVRRGCTHSLLGYCLVTPIHMAIRKTLVLPSVIFSLNFLPRQICRPRMREYEPRESPRAGEGARRLARRPLLRSQKKEKKRSGERERERESPARFCAHSVQI